MSFSDTILSNTVGIAWRAYSGTVDPWTLANQKEQTAADIAQASGASQPEIYGPVDQGVLAANQAKAASDIDSNLLEQKMHPSQAGFRIPGLGNLGSEEFLQKAEHIVYGLLLVGGLAGVAYFTYKFRRTLADLVK